MPSDEPDVLPPERDTAAMLADLHAQAARVGVDWGAAAPALRELARAWGAAASGEEVLALSPQALLAVLRALPDGAGTPAFVAEYRRRNARPDPPST